MAKDTIAALYTEENIVDVYKALQITDSVVFLSEKVANQFELLRLHQEAVIAQAGSISELIKQNEIIKAKRYIQSYISDSGFFDNEGNIEKGREVFYYIIGSFYLQTSQLDSAEYFFRKELQYGKDYNNQNSGAHGLALLFQQKNMPDSAAKYALYSYEMNDSLYAQMTTDDITHIQALYNYSRQQELAQKEHIRAEKNANRLRLSLSIILLIGMLSYIVVIREKQKRKEAYEKYINSLYDLQQSKEELLLMQQHETVFGNLISEKEKHVKYLEGIVEQYENEQGHKLPVKESELFLSPLFKQIEGISNRGELLGDEKWNMVEEEVQRCLPNFWIFLSSNKSELTIHEYKVCLLTRLKIKPKSMGHMLGLSAASISKIRISLLFKLFGAVGKPSEFDNRIKKI